MATLTFNKQGHLYLNKAVLNAIFDCVYDVFPVDANGMIIFESNPDVHPSINKTTQSLLHNTRFQHFMRELKWRQDYNYRNRKEDCYPLFERFNQTIGPMETNSEGTTLYLALGLALKEYYNLRNETLFRLMESVTIRK